MIKVIGERNKIFFFSIFDFKVIHWEKGKKIRDDSEIIENDDKLLIVDEKILELEEILEKKKTFPLLFALYPKKGKGLLEKLLWK
ncbi:MAG: hypothetical protein ABIK81_00570 [candidate division WOR-3 bacterium]